MSCNLVLLNCKIIKSFTIGDIVKSIILFLVLSIGLFAQTVEYYQGKLDSLKIEEEKTLQLLEKIRNNISDFQQKKL